MARVFKLLDIEDSQTKDYGITDTIGRPFGQYNETVRVTFLATNQHEPIFRALRKFIVIFV